MATMTITILTIIQAPQRVLLILLLLLIIMLLVIISIILAFNIISTLIVIAPQRVGGARCSAQELARGVLRRLFFFCFGVFFFFINIVITCFITAFICCLMYFIYLSYY